MVIKSDDREARVRFVYHKCDYSPNWTPLIPITITYCQLIIKMTVSEKRRIGMRKGDKGGVNCW